MMARALAIGVVLAGILASLACATRTVGHQPVDGDWRWPLEAPRLQLIDILVLPAPPRGLNGEQAAGVRLHGVTWHGEDLLVTDPDGRRLLRLAANGTLTATGDSLFMHPVDVAACDQGIVVSDAAAGKVAVLEPDLSLRRWLAVNLNRPTGITCDEQGVWVAETGDHALLAIGWNGSRRRFGQRGGNPGEFNYPTSLALAPDRVIVGDTMNFRLQVLDRAAGRFLSTFGDLGDAAGNMPRIKDIAIDADGQIWVSDAHLDRVSLYRQDGQLLISLGGRGMRPAEFSFPAGIASHPDGRIAVVDGLNQRIQVFQLVNRP